MNPLHPSCQLLTAAVLLCLLGCQSSNEMTSTTSEQSHALLDAPSHEYDIDIDMLEKLIDSAASAMHWGVARITNEITALHASAWTASDQPVDIRAQQTGVTGVNVQVKVGLFGDPQQEQAFHDALAQAIQKRRAQR